ncbi:uncharacterized protein [Clytia hemisphaerica]|uniref:Fe2OG dioxygenase domain-containing protein n=1 Tax=Clytia hemisphaerica TaxID=252671 RepID=A0A7M5VD38_9CNID|eukprot:TCONS_00003314-protein
MDQLPIIDLSLLNPLNCDFDTIFDKEETLSVAKSLYNALSHYGFLYITGHGIPDNVISDAFGASKEFFKPVNRAIHKTHYRRKGKLLGYVDGLNERDLPENPIDLKQGYDFTLKSPEFDEMPGEQKPAIKELYKHFETLSQFILRFLGVSLDVGTDYFLPGHTQVGDITKNSSTMRILYYQAVNGEILEKQSRMSDHTDFGTFTMLMQDQVGGLQVLSPTGHEFINAVPIKNSIIFNVGDLLQTWSQGKLKSTLHRVILPKEMVRLQMSRQSIVYFTNPDNSFMITGTDENGNVEKKSVLEHMEERNNTTIIDVAEKPIPA